MATIVPSSVNILVINDLQHDYGHCLLLGNAHERAVSQSQELQRKAHHKSMQCRKHIDGKYETMNMAYKNLIANTCKTYT